MTYPHAMIRILCLVLCLAQITPSITAQYADERIGALVNESRWFELKRELETTPPESLSPVLETLAAALVQHYFNRPEAACLAIETLLTQHRNEINENTALNMAYLLGVNLSRQGKYREAAELMQSLADQLKAQWTDSNQAAGFQTVADMYKSYAGVGEICRPLHPEGTYTVPFHNDPAMRDKDGDFIALDGRLNRVCKRMLFDTGAGVNIISNADADACGLRRLDAYIDMQGIGSERGQMAIADTLQIGEMCWLHVPFLVVDIVTGHAEADKIIGGGLAPVIGLPVLFRMKEIRLDFAEQKLTVPASPTRHPAGRSNLMRKDNEGLRIEAHDRNGNPLYFHFDTGSSGSMLSARWFERNKELVLRTGTADSLRMGGIGGATIERSYRLPGFSLQLGSGRWCPDSITVCTGMDLHSGQPIGRTPFNNPEEDGTIGVNALEQFRQVIVNLQDMYIEVVP